jgi:hypothetical protein
VRLVVHANTDTGRVVAGPPGAVRIEATDLSASVHLAVGAAGVRVSSDPLDADIVIRGPSGLLMAAVAAPRLGPVPDPRSAAGRAVLGAFVTRRVRVRGALRRPDLLRSLRALLTTDPEDG